MSSIFEMAERWALENPLTARDDDAKAAAAARDDEGFARAYRAADEIWKDTAYQAIVHVAVRRDSFTTDAVWTVLDLWRAEPPREPRAIAGVLRRAMRDGICEPTGQRVNSVLKRGHCRPVMVYRSLRARVAA